MFKPDHNTSQSAEHELGEPGAQAIESLWARGTAADLRAIRRIQEAHPERACPALLQGPAGIHFCVAPDEHDAEQVARLLEGQYWTQGFSRQELARAQLGSNVWLVARDGKSREVVASARALSDGARLAYVLDVIVRSDLRGTGLGSALLRLLLRHPQVRMVRGLRLRTRDAQAFYRQLGFFTRDEAGEEMVRLGAG